MKHTISLKKDYEFNRTYKKGKSFADKNLVIYILKTNKNINGLGIIVSKKVGKSVVRSKVTRLIKENYRLKEQEIKKGFDILIIAKSIANNATYHDVNKSLGYLLKKHNMLTYS